MHLCFDFYFLYLQLWMQCRGKCCGYVLYICLCYVTVIVCIVVSVSAQCSLQPGLEELIHKFVEGACAVLVLCTAPCHSGGGRESTESVLAVLAKVASRALCVHAFRNTSALVRISLNRFRYFQFVVSLSSSHVFKFHLCLSLQFRSDVVYIHRCC